MKEERNKEKKELQKRLNYQTNNSNTDNNNNNNYYYYYYNYNNSLLKHSTVFKIASCAKVLVCFV